MVAPALVSPAELPEKFVRSAYENANRIAGLLGQFLETRLLADAEPDGPSNTLELPCVLLLELAAIQHLQLWEASGLLPHLSGDLPSPRDACEALACKLDHGLEQFATLQDATLWAMVNHVYCAQIAWEGPSILSADLAIGMIGEDELLDAVAEFLWHNRHSLASIEELNL